MLSAVQSAAVSAFLRMTSRRAELRLHAMERLSTWAGITSDVLLQARRTGCRRLPCDVYSLTC